MQKNAINLTRIEEVTHLDPFNNEEEMEKLATGKTTPPEILLALAKNECNHLIAPALAAHLKMPLEGLALLSRCTDYYTRYLLTQNPHTNIEILCILASDSSYMVRAGVARRPETPTDVLIRLAKDQHSPIITALCMNPSTPSEALNIIANPNHGGTLPKHLRMIAAHHNASPKLLTLMTNEEWYRCWAKQSAKSWDDALLPQYYNSPFSSTDFSRLQDAIAKSPVSQKKCQ